MINEQIGVALASIIALGLALKAGVGPVVMYLTEAIKDALQPPPGYGGIISIFTGVGLGAVVGALAALVTEGSGLGTFIAFGAVGGLFMASGAIESHKAASGINVSGSAAIADGIKAEDAQALETAKELGIANRFGYSFPNYGDSEAEYAADSRAEALHWSGAEIEDGEDDNFDWAEARESGGHTGQAIAVEPTDGIGEPSNDYLGAGPPPGLAGETVTTTSTG